MITDDPGTHSAGWGPFWRHFAEMVVAMLVGMMVLGMVVRGLFALAGRADLLDPVEVRALLMATNMSIGMLVLMRWRGHGWAGIAEMCAAMYVAFAVLLVPYWLDALSDRAVMMGGHLLMLPLMLLVMLRRRGEYRHEHPGRPGAAVAR